MAWLKDGYQQCPRCAGAGCYGCQKQGFVVLCPACASTDFIERRDPLFACTQCGAVFNRAGRVEDQEEVE